MSIMDLSTYIAEEIIIDEIMRSNMPQIMGKDYPEVLNIFKDYGVPYKFQVMNPNDLFPTQQDFIKSKVDNIANDITSGKEMNPIFISSDYYIIDGYHRWLANKQLNKLKMKVIKVGYPKRAALKLFNKLDDKLNEAVNNIHTVVAVYSGRFQPFHRGHYYVYNDLVSKFGKNNVYIATSNKTEPGTSPFSFKEKKEIIAKLFGIPGTKVVEVKNPYRPEEILNKFDPKTTALVVAVGEKDANRLGGKYFTKYNGKPTEGYLDKGYVYIVPQLNLKINGKTISGTQVRNNFSKDVFKHIYPKFDNSIYNMMKQKLSEGIFVKCMICGELHKELPRHLFTKHNITGKNYKEKYPGSRLVSEEKRIKNRIGGKISGPHNKGKKRPDVSERNKNPEFIEKISASVKESYNKKPELRQLRSEQFKDEQVRNKIKETNYSNGNWKRPENKPEYINYLDKVRTITKENYNKYFYEIPNAKKRSREFHLDHKYSIHSGFVNNIPPEVIGHYKNLEILQHSLNESKFNKNSITLEQLILDIQNSKNPLDDRILLLCGGAFGHLKHPFEDMNLTFGDLKQMITLALEGKLELTQEKCIDGNSIIQLEKNGNITIKEVVDNKIEDKVFSYNIEKNKFEFKNIVDYANNGNTEEWLEIELENGNKIKVTPNHRIYVKDIGYVQAKDLTEDMELIIK